jgi:hypothetical protein
LTVSAAILAGLINSALPMPAAFAAGDSTTGTARKAAPETGEPARQPAPDASAPAASDSAIKITVDIPTIESADASISDEDLRAIFSGDVADHADELASLSATSIHIPELHVSYVLPPVAGKPKSSELVYRDIEIKDVTDGVAATAAMAGADFTGPDGTIFKLGKVSANQLDIGGLLAFYGLVDASGETPTTLYKDFAADGATLTGPDVSCKFGKITQAEIKARPLKVSITEFLTLAQEMEAQKDAKPKPETIAKFITFYTDYVKAIQTAPMNFGGIDCSGKAEDGSPLAVSVGATTIGAFANGRYPEIGFKDVKINMDKDGQISLGSVLVKGFDYSGAIASLDSATAAGTLDDKWFEANVRQMIPAFDGLAFDNFTMDVADQQHAGQRIKAAVGSFDLSLGAYINGIPSDISTSATHLVFDLPVDPSDDSLKQLHALGINKVDAGYDFSAKWDEASQSIKLGKLSFSGADLGSLALAGTIGNAVKDLFSSNNDQALASAIGLTVKDLKLDLQDSGLKDLLLKSAAAEQGKDPEQFRAAASGMAQGTILAILGATEEAKKLSDAVGSFLNGAKSLTIAIAAKEPAGIGMADFMAAQSDPTTLATKVTIDASAK